MARYVYLALTRAVSGCEAAFDAWYDERHLGDVVRISGVVSAQRFNLEWQKSSDFDAPQWRSLAIYEIEADDPQVTLAAISAAAETELMPLSEALDRTGMLQLIGRAVAAHA